VPVPACWAMTIGVVRPLRNGIDAMIIDPSCRAIAWPKTTIRPLTPSSRSSRRSRTKPAAASTWSHLLQDLDAACGPTSELALEPLALPQGGHVRLAIINAEVAPQ
jgi:hypothetical protein